MRPSVLKECEALLTAGVLVALAIGCSTTGDSENPFSAADFKTISADTQEKVTLLNSLPPDKITTVQRNRTLYYVFPDPGKNRLYVGEQAQYQQYQRICRQRQITEQQLSATEMNENAWGVWGNWGGLF